MSADRREVMTLVEARVTNEHLRRHMLACEAIMRAFAARFEEDEDEWGIAGLGHDLDAEETEDDFARHGVLAGEALASLGAGPEIVHAVAAHNGERTGVAPESRMDVALIVADQLERPDHGGHPRAARSGARRRAGEVAAQALPRGRLRARRGSGLDRSLRRAGARAR